MKALTTFALVTLLLIAASAQASSLRFDSTLINEGKPASLLLMHMGEPINKSITDVCTSQDRQGDCKSWTTSEIWFYHHNDLNYTITIFNGVIEKIEWSRF